MSNDNITRLQMRLKREEESYDALVSAICATIDDADIITALFRTQRAIQRDEEENGYTLP